MKLNGKQLRVLRYINDHPPRGDRFPGQQFTIVPTPEIEGLIKELEELGLLSGWGLFDEVGTGQRCVDFQVNAKGYAIVLAGGTAAVIPELDDADEFLHERALAECAEDMGWEDE